MFTQLLDLGSGQVQNLILFYSQNTDFQKPNKPFALLFYILGVPPTWVGQVG
ncbi:MAG: hypothetical protein ANABAC_1823 [Anaerolineae bacterium]|nr:MAG: hypothetical protein ANABAC_1823 [Anaerolineae bacterium]